MGLSKESFNKTYRESIERSPQGMPIIRRECLDCTDSHKVIYYKRKTSPKSFDAYYYLIVTWSSTNNLLHRDFELYSTFQDAVNDKNPWQYCNYNDRGEAFPRDCGPKKYILW